MSTTAITWTRDLVARAFADEIGAEELFNRDHVRNSQQFDDCISGRTTVSAGGSITPALDGVDSGGGGSGGSDTPATARVKTWTIPTSDVIYAGRILTFSPGDLGNMPQTYTVVGDEQTILAIVQAMIALYNARQSKSWTLTAAVVGQNVVITATADTAGVGANSLTPAVSWGNNTAVIVGSKQRVWSISSSDPLAGGLQLMAGEDQQALSTITQGGGITTLQDIADALIADLAANSGHFDWTTETVSTIVYINAIAKVAGTAANAFDPGIGWNPENGGTVTVIDNGTHDGVDAVVVNNVTVGTNTDGVDAVSGGGSGGSSSTSVLACLWLEVEGQIAIKVGDNIIAKCTPPSGKKTLLVMENVMMDGPLKFDNTDGHRDVRVVYFVAYTQN